MHRPLPLGNMLWRIGRLLDIDRQLDWTQHAGFHGVGLHASAGLPGQWRGVEPSRCSPARRRRLRERLAAFTFTEIHAPFAIELSAAALADGLAALAPVLEFAGELGARVLTVHAQPPGEGEPWRRAMQQLDALAAQARTLVALEITSGFEAVLAWDLPHLGVNLDVGHMVLPHSRPALERYGGFAPLIRLLAPKLVHLHLHDVRGGTDHLEVGEGGLPFAEVIATLVAVGYTGTATLELNPDRVAPAGIRRSLDVVRELWRTGPPAAS